MAKRESQRDENRVHYRHYGRLLSYLRYHRVRCLIIVLVLLGEAVTGLFGIVMLKPVLDLVFRDDLYVLEIQTTEIPLVITTDQLIHDRAFVARLAGGMGSLSAEELPRQVVAWLGHPDTDLALVDIRALEEIAPQGWADLIEMGLLAQDEPGEFRILTEDAFPPDIWPPALSGTVALSAEHPDLVAIADRAEAPDLQGAIEAASAVEGWKASMIERMRPTLERFQAYATQDSWHRYLVLVWLSVIIVVLTVIRCIFGFYAGYLTGYTCDAVSRRIKDELYQHLLYQEEGFFSKTNVGHLMTNVTQDVDVTRPAIETIFLGVVKGPVNLLVLLAGMIFISPILTLYTFVMLPALMGPTLWVARVVRRYSRKSQKKRSKLNVVLHETLVGMRIIRAYGTEETETQRFSRENWKLFGYKIKSEMANSAAAQLTILLSTLGMCAILLLNGYFIIEKQSISGSDFIVFLLLMVNIYRPIKGLTKANTKIIQAMAGAERFFPILDRASQVVEKPGAEILPPFQGRIIFENVTFSYGENPVLRNIELEVPAGQVTAIVGASGSGKTTLVNLLPRFWDPTEGRILADGHDLRDVTLRSLRSQIAIVTQESILFDDTVRNNIAYGQPDLPFDRIEEAARAANAHDFILELPDGYDTVIGDRGARLSGGQKQRISIARALVKGSPILILDEATSALDTEAEREVQAAIERLIKGHTAFVIAHRLSTIVNADEIIVLREGEIVERGRHDDLLARNGDYARFCRLQFETER